MKQRDLMKRLYKELGPSRAKVCEAFAAAERAGQVTRKRGTEKTSPEQYASDLWSDGIRKGWLSG
jgi:hypothetical protein